MNLDFPETPKSIFQRLCDSVGRLNDITIAPPPMNAVEAILAVMVTDSPARTGSTATSLGFLKSLDEEEEWASEILPKGTIFGSGGSAFNYSQKAEDNSTEFEMRTTILGYGYRITTATLLSIIFLSVYVLIAVIYVSYLIFYPKTTSSA